MLSKFVIPLLSLAGNGQECSLNNAIDYINIIVLNATHDLKNTLSFDLPLKDVDLFLKLRNILKKNDDLLSVIDCYGEDKLVYSIFLLVNELGFDKLGNIDKNANIISKIIDFLLLFYFLYYLAKSAGEGNLGRANEILYEVLNDILGPFDKATIIKELTSYYGPNIDKKYTDLIKNVLNNYGEVRNYNDLQSMVIEEFKDYFDYMDLGIRVNYMFSIEEVKKVIGDEKKYISCFRRLINVIFRDGDFSNEKIVDEFRKIFDNYYKNGLKSFEEFEGWFEMLYGDLYNHYILVKNGYCGDEFRNQTLDHYLGGGGFLLRFDLSDCVQKGLDDGLDYCTLKRIMSQKKIKAFLNLREICNGEESNLRCKFYTYGERKRLLESMIINEIRENMPDDGQLSSGTSD